MDPHVRWLRRFVLSRAVARVVAEAVAIAVAALAVALVIGVDPVVGIVLSAVVAQLFAASRLGAAILANPVNHRYLMAWPDDADRLQPTTDRGRAPGPLDASLAGDGLHHLVTLESFDPKHADRPDRRQAIDRHEVYASPCRLVVATVGAEDRPFTVLSRLADGRLLVTSAEMVPPHCGLVINLSRRGSPAELILSHVEALDELRRRGLPAVRAGHEVVIDQLHLEWLSWNQLGPFVGPLLAVDPRRQPLLLQVRPSRGVLWDRSAETVGQWPATAERPEAIRLGDPAPVV